MFGRMAAWGLNAYLYAPKDDLKHRALWRECYTAEETAALRSVADDARRRGLRFIYALAPGLDVRYGDPADFAFLARRLEQLTALGLQDFALLFDDIPDRMRAEDQARWGSFADAQCDLTRRVLDWVRAHAPGGRFLFCPTPYCGRMADRGLGGPGYLDAIGRQLPAEVDIFWTGPEIISREISVGHLQEVGARLRRKPLLWDNLHANDYDGRRFYCGPYAGRDPAIRAAVAGILTNPNTEFPLNYVPVRTLAAFLAGGPVWDARAAYLRAMREWWPQFATVGGPVAFEDLVLLGDAYYLPHEDGPEARMLFDELTALLGSDAAAWPAEQVEAFRVRAAQLKDFCARMAELKDRPLFYALSRRVWELREELDLLLGYVRIKAESRGAAPAASDFHLSETYRGGYVARLQELLEQNPDGTFTTRRREVDKPEPPPADADDVSSRAAAGGQPAAGSGFAGVGKRL